MTYEKHLTDVLENQEYFIANPIECERVMDVEVLMSCKIDINAYKRLKSELLYGSYSGAEFKSRRMLVADDLTDALIAIRAKLLIRCYTSNTRIAYEDVDCIKIVEAALKKAGIEL